MFFDICPSIAGLTKQPKLGDLPPSFQGGGG